MYKRTQTKIHMILKPHLPELATIFPALLQIGAKGLKFKILFGRKIHGTDVISD
jgi:hypothetical protein